MCEQLKAAGTHVLSTKSTSDLLDVAEKLGRPVPITPKAALVDTLTPMRRPAAPARTLSSLYGTGAFPLHTDAAHHRWPPRWILLRCVEPGDEGRPTLVADAHELDLGRRQIREIRRAVWSVKTGLRSFLASALFSRADESAVQKITQFGLRYDLGCMRPADPEFAEAATLLATSIRQLPRQSITWEPGLSLILDNWRVLHGRGDGAERDAGVRRLERIAVSERLP
jgi:alpha-ketoglutarate-dependent taurine dioxygenase